MTTRFQKARFHIDSGPRSLFERIHYKMDSVCSLNLSAKHFVERCKERVVPAEIIQKMQNIHQINIMFNKIVNKKILKLYFQTKIITEKLTLLILIMMRKLLSSCKMKVC